MPYKVLQENRYDSDDNDLISVYESIVNEELKKKGGGILSSSLPKVDAHEILWKNPGDADWGELHLPNPLLIAARAKYNESHIAQGTLKVCVFGSLHRGQSVLASMLDIDKYKPDIAVLTGLCTDGAHFNDARISLKKRAWQFIPEDQREAYVYTLIDMALSQIVPAYSGEVKSKIFKERILPELIDPDLIIMATFGQKIDEAIYSFPRYGMYNLHPSHLAEGKYPGPNPFFDMLEAGETKTRLTLHWVQNGIDEGKVVGFSPEICIELADPSEWSRSDHIIALHSRIATIAGVMAGKLVSEVHSKKGKIHEFDFESYLNKIIPKNTLKELQSPIKKRKLNFI